MFQKQDKRFLFQNRIKNYVGESNIEILCEKRDIILYI